MMNSFSATRFFWLLVFLGAGPLLAQEELIEQAKQLAQSVQIESLETTFDQELGIARAKGDVVIRYQGSTIYAKEAEYHQTTGDIFARRQVSIFKDGQIFRGDEAVYNINTGIIVASGIRGGMDPIFYDTGEVTLPTADTDVIRTQDTFVTTSDLENPSYKVKAKRIDIYPDKYIVFRHATVSVRGVPVAYMPIYAQPLNDELGYYFTPGYNDNWGAFLLNQYGFLIGDHTLATAHLDVRATRGVAGGIDLQSMRHKNETNFGNIQFYYAQDNEPNLNSVGELRANNTDPERYRLNIQHRVYLPGPEESSLYLDVDVNKLSDQYFYMDFFPGEFRNDPQPDNLVNLIKTHPRGTISLLARDQLNEFFRTDTRLPELAIDAIRQPIFNTGLFYEGNTSFGIYEEKLGDPERINANNRIRIAESRLDRLNSGVLDPSNITFDPLEEADLIGSLRRTLDENSFDRFFSYHQVSYPGSVGWLSVVPRAGVGYANYSDVDGNLGTTEEFDRTIGHLGVDLSAKFSKVYDGVHNRALGLDELRHIFQPYTRFSYLTGDDYPEDFGRIDRLTLSTKQRPLDVTRFTATDDLNNWNIVRLGGYNSLQTKRNGGTFPWLDLNTFVDVYAEDPEYNRDYSNLFNELRWIPLPWLSANIDSQLPIGGGMDFTEVNSYMTFQPLPYFQFSAGHFWLDDHPFFQNSNNLRFTTYTRLGDQWGVGTAHFYEFRDGTLELQQYTLHRDLSSWTAAIGAQVRDNRVQDEFSFIFSLTLKAFPRVGLPVDFVGTNGIGGSNRN